MVTEQKIRNLTNCGLVSVNHALKLAKTLEKVTKTEDLSENTLTALIDLMQVAEQTQDALRQTQKKRDEYHGYWQNQRDELRRLRECLDTINTLRKMIHYDE